MELAASADQEALGGTGVLDTKPEVDVELLVKPRPQLAGGGELALTTGEWRRVDPKGHPDRGLVNLYARQWIGRFGIGERVADRHFLEAGEQHDVPGACARHGN